MENTGNEAEEIRMNIDEVTLPVVEKIADCMPGGFFIYYADGDEQLIYYNQSMLRIFGCDTREEFEELTGNSFKGIVYPDDLDNVERSIIEQIYNSEHNMDYVEYRIIRKDGSIRWVEDYGHFSHTDIYGDVYYVFIEDATDRMEKRLSELEKMNEKLRNAYVKECQYKKAILRNSAVYYEVNLSKDKFTNSVSRIVDGQVGDIFELMGIPPVSQYSVYIEMSASKVNESERAAFIQFFDSERLIRCYHKGELEQVCEAWVTDAIGRRRLNHYVVLLGMQEYSGDVIALSVCTDITEQIERQNLFQVALRQAQSANIARNTFLSNMSHDMRTPLNVILGYADLLLEYCKDPKVLDYVEKIRLSSAQLLAIVKDSMEVTWAESGKAVLTETKCNIEDIVQEIKAETDLMMKRKKLTFLLKCENIRHVHLFADAIRLKEILTQLLDNSVKYTDSGGFVRLTVREETSAQEGYGRFAFVVQDNGIGIADDFKENLFLAFSREKNTTMSKVSGFGLGLTVVKTFVDMMEGTIHVESKVGEGSTFTVRILFRLDEEGSDEEPVEVKALDCAELTGKRILLVEDNELNAEIAAELLAQEGLLVEKAEDGQIAVEKVKNSSAGYYCAILMDIQMPVMDGYEATRQIRKLENSDLASTPIIALTANAFPEDRQKSLECGMDAHVPKPIDIKGLMSILRKVLAGRV